MESNSIRTVFWSPNRTGNQFMEINLFRYSLWESIRLVGNQFSWQGSIRGRIFNQINSAVEFSSKLKAKQFNSSGIFNSEWKSIRICWAIRVVVWSQFESWKVDSIRVAVNRFEPWIKSIRNQFVNSIRFWWCNKFINSIRLVVRFDSAVHWKLIRADNQAHLKNNQKDVR